MAEFEAPFRNVDGVAALKPEFLLEVYQASLKHAQEINDSEKVEKYERILKKVTENDSLMHVNVRLP